MKLKLRLKLIVMISLNIDMMTSQDHICVQCVTNSFCIFRPEFSSAAFLVLPSLVYISGPAFSANRTPSYGPPGSLGV